MDTLKKYNGFMIPVGTRVWSKTIGSKQEFWGVITAHFKGAYHVQDEDGNGWHRERGEISLSKPEEKAE